VKHFRISAFLMDTLSGRKLFLCSLSTMMIDEKYWSDVKSSDGRCSLEEGNNERASWACIAVEIMGSIRFWQTHLVSLLKITLRGFTCAFVDQLQHWEILLDRSLATYSSSNAVLV
jgi:hypothetical protein